MTKLVPAHPPSKADPAAVAIGIITALLALFGLNLSDYLTAEQTAAIGGGLIAVAGAGRAIWQRKRAQQNGRPEPIPVCLHDRDTPRIDEHE